MLRAIAPNVLPHTYTIPPLAAALLEDDGRHLLGQGRFECRSPMNLCSFPLTLLPLDPPPI